MRPILQKAVTKHAYSGVRSFAGRAGPGAGKGGGGSIREAGGAFGAMEAAREDQYFYNKQKEQLKDLKKHLSGQIEFHEDQIKRHQKALKQAHDKVADLVKDERK